MKSFNEAVNGAWLKLAVLMAAACALLGPAGAFGADYHVNNNIGLSQPKANSSSGITIDFGHAWNDGARSDPLPSGTDLSIYLHQGMGINRDVAEPCDRDIFLDTQSGCPDDSRLNGASGVGRLDMRDCNLGYKDVGFVVFRISGPHTAKNEIDIGFRATLGAAEAKYLAYATVEAGRPVLKIENFSTEDILACKIVLDRGQIVVDKGKKLAKKVKQCRKKKGKKRCRTIKKKVMTYLVQTTKACPPGGAWDMKSDQRFADGARIEAQIPVRCEG